ncbi:MAG: 2-oxoacid ferredoxin oxidoreductase [Candidatus Heimdallarchaeota archaeon]|nr:2-oxoacid ferredoxin oxidoreductase [Candidatus Heimdallarchaeota archaeon]
MLYDKKKFVADIKPNWCPGCGDYGLLSATTKALSKLGYEPNETVIVSGIGCSSSFPHWTTAYGMHVLHGRALPTASAIHMVNPDLKVIVVGGDGDGYGIGVGHFVHAARRNLDITYLVMNNQIYGLTLGQSSPSSQVGHVTLTTPEGVGETPINPITLALGAGASFVARGFSGDGQHLQNIVEEALSHKGFSLVDVLSPCVTFNKLNTYDWFKERVYRLEDEGHDKNSITSAFTKGLEWDDRIPIGTFYKQQRPTLRETDVTAAHKIVVNEPLSLVSQGIDQNSIFNEFR